MKSKRPIEPIYRKIGLAIQDAREVVGMTQKQVERRAGLGVNALNGIERAKNRHSVHVLVAIAKALRVPLHHLLPV